MFKLIVKQIQILIKSTLDKPPIKLIDQKVPHQSRIIRNCENVDNVSQESEYIWRVDHVVDLNVILEGVLSFVFVLKNS